jgi:hypothetical protein
MNVSGMDFLGMPQRFDYHCTRCASDAIAWKNPETSGSSNI